MDQELYAYLEESRRLTIESIRAELSQNREETGRRFTQLEGRIDGLDGRIAGLEGRIDGLDGRIAGLEGRIDAQGESLREEIRHTRVLLEAARDEIRLLGEGMMGLTETSGVFRTEIRGQLAELRALITPLYKSLRERLEILEARAERQTRDVLDVIRERYGKPQAP